MEAQTILPRRLPCKLLKKSAKRRTIWREGWEEGPLSKGASANRKTGQIIKISSGVSALEG